MFNSISSCVPNTQVTTAYKATTGHKLDIWSNVTVQVNFTTVNTRPIDVAIGDYVEARVTTPAGFLSHRFIPYTIDGTPQYFATVNRNNFNPTVRSADVKRKWYNYVNFSQEISFYDNNELGTHLQNLVGWNKNLIDVEELHIVLDTLNDSVHFYSKQREMIHRVLLPAGPIEYRKIGSILGYNQYSFDLLVICSDYRLYRVFFDSRYVVSDEFKPKVIPLFSLDNLPYTQDLPNGLSFLDLARARFLSRLFPIVTALDVTATTIWLAGSEEVYKLNTKFQLISKTTIAGEEIVCVAALQTGAIVTTKSQRIFYVDGSTALLLHQATALGSPASINFNNQVVVPDANNQRLLVFSDYSGSYTIWPTPDFVPAYARVFENTLWVTGHDSFDVLRYINDDAYVKVSFDEKVTLVSVIGSSILASHYLKDYSVLDTTGIKKIVPIKFASRAGPVSHIGTEPQRIRMIGDQALTAYASPGLTVWTNGIANEPINTGDYVGVSYKASAEGKYKGAVVIGESAIDYTVDVFSNTSFYDHYLEVDNNLLLSPENALANVNITYSNVTIGNRNNGMVANIALDFAWNQYGTYYSNINVGTNGYITFDSDYVISNSAAAPGSLSTSAIHVNTQDLYFGLPVDNRDPVNITVGNLTTGETPGVYIQNQIFRNFEGKRIRYVGTRMDALPLGVTGQHQVTTSTYNKIDIDLATFNTVKVGDYVSGAGFTVSTRVTAKRAYALSLNYYKSASNYVLLLAPYSDIEKYSSAYVGTTRYGVVTGTNYTVIAGNRYLGFVGNTIFVDGQINSAVTTEFLVDSFGSKYYEIVAINQVTETITSLLSTTGLRIFVSQSDQNQIRLIQTIATVNRYVIAKENIVKTFTATADQDYITEGNSVVITVTTNNVDTGTVIPYTISGVGPEDIVAPADLVGNITISSGTASLTITANADLVTESIETIYVTFGRYSAIVSSSVTVQIDLEDENTSNRIANTTTVTSSITEYALLLNAATSVTQGQSLSYDYTTIEFDRAQSFGVIGANLVYQLNRLDLTSVPPEPTVFTGMTLKANLVTLSQNVSVQSGDTVLFKTFEPAPTVSYEVGLYSGLNFQFIELYYPVQKFISAGIIKKVYDGYFDDNLDWVKTAQPIAVSYENQFTIASPSLYTSGRTYEWVGYFKPTVTALHTFALSSDDASYVWIGERPAGSYTSGNSFLALPGRHDAATTYASISLVANEYYPIKIIYGDGGGAAVFSLTYMVTGSNTIYTMAGKLYRSDPYVDSPTGPVFVKQSANIQFGPTAANSTVYSDFVSAPQYGSYLFGSNLNDGQWVYLGPGSFTEINQGFNGRYPRLIRIDRDDDFVQYEFLIEQNFPTFTEVVASLDYGSVMRNGAYYTGYSSTGLAKVSTNDFFVIKIPTNTSLRPIAPIFSIGNYQVAIPTAPNSVQVGYQKTVNLYANQEYYVSVSGQATILMSGTYLIPDIYRGALRQTGIDYELFRERSGVRTAINPGTHEFLINDLVIVENLLTSRRYHDISEIVIVGPQTVTITFKTKHEPVFGTFVLDPLENPFVRQVDYGPDGLYLEPDVKYASNSHQLSGTETVYSTRLFIDYPGVEIVLNDQQHGQSVSAVKTADVLRLRHTVNSYFEEKIDIFQHLIDYDAGNIYIPIGQWSVNNLPISDQGIVVNHTLADNVYQLDTLFRSHSESRANMPGPDELVPIDLVVVDTPGVDPLTITENFVPMPTGEQVQNTVIYEDMPLPDLIENFTFTKLVLLEDLIADFTIHYENMPEPELIAVFTENLVELDTVQNLADYAHTVIYEPMPEPALIDLFSIVIAETSTPDLIDNHSEFIVGYTGVDLLLAGTRSYIDTAPPDLIDNFTYAVFGIEEIDKIAVATEFDFEVSQIEKISDFNEIVKQLPDPEEILNYTEIVASNKGGELIAVQTDFLFDFDKVEIIANYTEFDFSYTQDIIAAFSDFSFGFDYVERIPVFTENLVDGFAAEVIAPETNASSDMPDTDLIVPFSYNKVNPGEYYLPKPFSYVIFDDKGFDQITPFSYNTVAPGDYYLPDPFSYVIFDDKGFDQIAPFSYNTVEPGDYYLPDPFSYVIFDDKGFDQIKVFTEVVYEPGERKILNPHTFYEFSSDRYRIATPETTLVFNRSDDQGIAIEPIPTEFYLDNNGYIVIPDESLVLLEDYDGIVIDPFTEAGADLPDIDIIQMFTLTGSSMPEAKILAQHSESREDVTKKGLVYSLTDFRRDLEFVFFYNDLILYDNNSRGLVSERSFNTIPLEFVKNDISLFYRDTDYEPVQNTLFYIDRTDDFIIYGFNLFYGDTFYESTQFNLVYSELEFEYNQFNLYYSDTSYDYLQNSLFYSDAAKHDTVGYSIYYVNTGYDYLQNLLIIPDTVIEAEYEKHDPADGLYVDSVFFAYNPVNSNVFIQEQLDGHNESYWFMEEEFVYYDPWDTGTVIHEYVQNMLRLYDIDVVPDSVQPTEFTGSNDYGLLTVEQILINTEAVFLQGTEFYLDLYYELDEIPLRFFDMEYILFQPTAIEIEASTAEFLATPSEFNLDLDFTFYYNTLLTWDLEFVYDPGSVFITQDIDFELTRPELPEFATNFVPDYFTANEQFIDVVMIKDFMHYVDFASNYAPVFQEITLRMFDTGYNLTAYQEVNFAENFVPQLVEITLQLIQTEYDLYQHTLFSPDNEFIAEIFWAPLQMFDMDFVLDGSSLVFGDPLDYELIAPEYLYQALAAAYFDPNLIIPDTVFVPEFAQARPVFGELDFVFMDQATSVYMDIDSEYLVNDFYYLDIGHEFILPASSAFFPITIDDVLTHTEFSWGIESEFVTQPSQQTVDISETFYTANPFFLDIGYEHLVHEKIFYSLGYELFIETFIYENINMQYVTDNRYLFDIVVFEFPITGIPITNPIVQEYAVFEIMLKELDEEFYLETQIFVDAPTQQFDQPSEIMFGLDMQFFEPHYLEFDITNNFDIERAPFMFGDLDFEFYRVNQIDSGTNFVPVLTQTNDRYGTLGFELVSQHLIDFASNFLPELRPSILRMFHLGYELVQDQPYLVDLQMEFFQQSLRTLMLQYEYYYPHLVHMDLGYELQPPILLFYDLVHELSRPVPRLLDLNYELVRPTEIYPDLTPEYYIEMWIYFDTVYELLDHTRIFRDTTYELLDHTIIYRDIYYEYLEHTQIYQFLYNEKHGWTHIFIDGPIPEQELYKEFYTAVLEKLMDEYTRIELSNELEIESGATELPIYLAETEDASATEIVFNSDYFFDSALSYINIELGMDFVAPEKSEKIQLTSDFVNVEQSLRSIFLDPYLFRNDGSIEITLEVDMDRGAIGSFLLESEFELSPAFNQYWQLYMELEDSTAPMYSTLIQQYAGATSQFTAPLSHEFVAYNRYTKRLDSLLVSNFGVIVGNFQPEVVKPTYIFPKFEVELERDPLWEMEDITKYGVYRTTIQRFARVKNPSETLHDYTYCVEVPENQRVVFECPKNYIIRTVDFASFGTPNGNCGTFSANAICHSLNSQTVAEQMLLHRSGNIEIAASTVMFKDPGPAANRKLVVQFTAVRAGRYTNRDNLFRATGGTRSYYDDYAYHTYKSSSTFVPAEDLAVEFVAVGGGGGGGADDNNPLGSGLGLTSTNPFASVGTGGGGGGAVFGTYNVKAGQTVTVFVGQGGRGGNIMGAGGAGGVTTGPNFELDIYNEGTNANLALQNWSNSTIKSMTDFGGLGTMTAHQGLPGATLTFSLSNLDTHQEIRLQFYWHTVGSLDGEYNEFRLDGTKWYSFSKSFRNAPGVTYLRPGATTSWSGHRTYSYQPYGGADPDGYTVFDTGYFPHTASTLTAAWQFGHDEPDDNEAQYISHVKVSTRKIYDSATTRGGNGGNAGAQGLSGGGGGGGSFSGIATTVSSYTYAEPTTLAAGQLQYWNNTATFNMTNLGGLGAVTAHGPLNNATFTITHPLPLHSKARYQVYFHCVDSFDGETQEIKIDNVVWARFTKGYNTAPVFTINKFASATWTPASYSFSPAPFASLEGYIKFDTGYFDHTTDTIIVEHKCGLDEPQTNEGAYLSNVRITTPADIVFIGIAGGGAGGGGANEGYANNVTAPGGGDQPNAFIEGEFAGGNGASFIGDGGGGGGGGSGRWGGVGQTGIMSGGQGSGGGNFVSAGVINGVKDVGESGLITGQGGAAFTANIPYPFSAGQGGNSNQDGAPGAVVIRYLKKEVIPDFIFFEREYNYGFGGYTSLASAGAQSNKYVSAVPYQIPGTNFFNYRILFNTQIYAVPSRPAQYFYPSSKLSAKPKFFSNIGTPIPYDHAAPADNTIKYVIAQRKRWPMLWLIRGG